MICEICVCEKNNVLRFDNECLGDGMSVIPAEKTILVEAKVTATFVTRRQEKYV
jgi:hypothetical protein